MKKLLITSLILLTLSCVTKSKVVEEEKQKTEITTKKETKKEETQVTEEKKDQVKTVDSTSEKEETTITRTKDQQVDIEADSSGVVTREVSRTPDGFKETFTGAKKINIRESTKDETKSLREQINVLKETVSEWKKSDSLNLVTSETEKTTLVSEYEKRLKDKDEKIGSGWFWWFVGSAGLNVLFIVYLVRRKYKKIRGSPL